MSGISLRYEKRPSSTHMRVNPVDQSTAIGTHISITLTSRCARLDQENAEYPSDEQRTSDYPSDEQRMSTCRIHRQVMC